MKLKIKPAHVFEAVMVLLALAYIFPALFVILSSFKTDAAITRTPLALPEGLNLANYARAWSAMNFPMTVLRTLAVTAGGVAGIIFFSAMAAYKLARTPTRLSWVIYAVFVFAMVIPFQIIMVPVVVLATDLGIKDFWGIIPMYWGLGMPMATFMYHGFVKGVPRELEESAAIDGAGGFYTYFRVVFPLLKPVTATVAILNSLWIWNDFLLPLIVIKKGTLQLEQMKFYGLFLREYGPLTASLVLSALPIVVFYLFLQRYIIKGVAAGAVKG